MKEGVVPNQELVEIEMSMMTKLMRQLPIEVVEIDFPYFLDKKNKEQRQHDFVGSDFLTYLSKRSRNFWDNSEILQNIG